MTYPSHPFIHDAPDLSDAEIQAKINDLYTKLSGVYRTFNPNVYLIQQLEMAIATYQTELQTRQDKRRQDNSDDFNSIIDISS